jgi:hypothetical protein
MPLDTPPALSTARSHSTHSTVVLDRMDAVSRGPKAQRHQAVGDLAHRLGGLGQVQLRQMPKSFWRIQTLGPRAFTAFQNSAGMAGTTGVAQRSHDDARLGPDVGEVPEVAGPLAPP